MQKKNGNRLKGGLLSLLLLMAVTLSALGCGDGKEKAKEDAPVSTETESQASGEAKSVGEGSTMFLLTVVYADGAETQFEVHTDQETVGAALTELKLIDGEDGEYGLYVTSVNGVTVDFEKDGAYWAFYINGEYAQTGVDATPIAEGESYSFKVEKA